MNSVQFHLRPSSHASSLPAHSRFSFRSVLRAGLTLAAGLVAMTAAAQLNYATPYFFTTLAGVNASGSLDGTLTGARFFLPAGIAVEANGTVYVADTNNHTIRKITFFGVVTTIAGTAGSPGTANGTGGAARFNLPRGLAVDTAGNVYVADTSNHAIRKITPAGVVTILAGGTAGGADGTGAAARLLSPNSVALDGSGNVYVADTANHSIRKITPEGVVTTLAGPLNPSGFGNVDGAGAAAKFNSPRGVAVDGAGNVYVADRDNNKIRKITAGGLVTTMAGFSNNITGAIDGSGSDARFNGPNGVAVDAGGNVYVTDSSNKLIRKVTQAGVVTTVAGIVANGSADGLGSAARFMDPIGIAADARGNLYVADMNNHTVRMSVFAPDIAPQPISQVVAPGANATLTSGATSNVPITFQWRKDGVAIPGATTATIVPSPNTPTASSSSVTVTNIQTANLGNYTLVATNMAGSSTSNSGVLSFTPPPSFTTQPLAFSVAPGASVTFTAAAISSLAITYQWQKDGVAISGATNSALTLSNIQASAIGTYTLVATNSVGSTTSAPGVLSFVVSNAGRLTNLSIRSNAGTGAQTLIVGLVIGGANTTGTKPLLIRGAGPALGVFGVPGFLADPSLSVFSGTTVLSSNDNWNGDAQVTAIGGQLGAFPFGPTTSKDAALYSSALSAGAYTVQITGVGGTTGIALAEIYDATPANVFLIDTPRLINVSARTQVGAGADILITGFTIGGTTPKTLLIRAVGPTLGVFGVAGVLADPKLELYSGATLIQSNDNWAGAANIAGTAASVGAFPLDAASKDAVLLVTLPPGGYTAQVSGVGGTIGVALVEIYDVP